MTTLEPINSRLQRSSAPGPGGCVDWIGGRRDSEYGYGAINLGGNKIARAHRVAYCAARGISLASISGQLVRHLCNRDCCINPTHLAIGTAQDNYDDMRKAGREKKARGSANHKAKLTENQVLELRRLYAGSPRSMTQPELAAKFGITQAVVSKIINRAIWRHVGG